MFSTGTQPLGNKTMISVTTPDGKMNVASPLRSNGAVFVDLMLAFFLVQIFVGLLQILNLYATSTTLIGVLAVIVFGYPIASRRSKIPSFGSWALGTRTYPYSSIEGYSGKGNLVVFEPLKNGEYSHRAIVAVVVFSVLVASATVLASRAGN